VRPARSVVVAFAAAVAGCGRDDAAAPPPTPVAPRPPAARRAEPPPTRDPRLRDDCGGWEPPAELLDAAAALGGPGKKAALDALAAAPAAQRIDTLRAGLRLADDAAAKACAARLEYEWIDRWECARCVDLLRADVFRPGTEADWEKFRSYLGSVELTPFLKSLPPTPWSEDPDGALSQLHRICLVEHMPALLGVTHSADAAVAKGAWEDVGLLCRWNDDFRVEVETACLVRDGGQPPAPSADDATGLPPVLAAYLRNWYLNSDGSAKQERKGDLDDFDRRWLWECTPGPKDAALLTALASVYDSQDYGVGGTAIALLGKLGDPATEALLRKLVDEDDADMARWALARRGDAAMIDYAAAHVGEYQTFALAVLMEADPKRARRVIEETLFGEDDAAAQKMLTEFSNFATPGAWWEPFGFDWRRTSLAGLDAAAISAKIPAVRLARIGVVVPGCRTCALAEAAAKRLAPGDLVEDSDRDLDAAALAAIGGFLETGAPQALRTSLRAIRAKGGDDAALAARWLVALGDAETAVSLISTPDRGGVSLVDLARSRAPELRQALVKLVREALATKDPNVNLGEPVVALAVLDGFPPDAVSTLWSSENGPPRSAVDAALDGRPVDALAAVLTAAPDEPHGDVGAVDDPRVRAYLARLRERRDLGHSWYATAQLAVLGDAAGRAEFWGAMKDGRYRIMDEANLFERTLGWRLAETMPYWIEEARSQCCVLVTGGGGDILEDLLGLLEGCFLSPYRTPYRRAKEMWDAAGGRFVRSRILSNESCPRFVPAPR
jgi:hypothetical protein